MVVLVLWLLALGGDDYRFTTELRGSTTGPPFEVDCVLRGPRMSDAQLTDDLRDRLREAGLSLERIEGPRMSRTDAGFESRWTVVLTRRPGASSSHLPPLQVSIEERGLRLLSEEVELPAAAQPAPPRLALSLHPRELLPGQRATLDWSLSGGDGIGSAAAELELRVLRPLPAPFVLERESDPRVESEAGLAGRRPLRLSPTAGAARGAWTFALFEPGAATPIAEASVEVVVDELPPRPAALDWNGATGRMQLDLRVDPTVLAVGERGRLRVRASGSSVGSGPAPVIELDWPPELREVERDDREDGFESSFERVASGTVPVGPARALGLIPAERDWSLAESGVVVVTEPAGASPQEGGAGAGSSDPGPGFWSGVALGGLVGGGLALLLVRVGRRRRSPAPSAGSPASSSASASDVGGIEALAADAGPREIWSAVLAELEAITGRPASAWSSDRWDRGLREECGVGEADLLESWSQLQQRLERSRFGVEAGTDAALIERARACLRSLRER